MGKIAKALEAFIDDIPDSKLSGLPDTTKTLHKDTDFRLDMQGMTSDNPAKHNLQVQFLKKLAPMTVAGPALVAPGTSAADVRRALKDTIDR